MQSNYLVSKNLLIVYVVGAIVSKSVFPVIRAQSKVYNVALYIYKDL